jgi:hypothetical protein
MHDAWKELLCAAHAVCFVVRAYLWSATTLCRVLPYGSNTNVKQRVQLAAATSIRHARQNAVTAVLDIGFQLEISYVLLLLICGSEHAQQLTVTLQNDHHRL